MYMQSLLLLTAAMVTAPEAPTNNSSPYDAEIVVEGRRDRDELVRRFVDSVAVAPVGGQLSRFDARVCPVAIGLTGAQNERVTRRFRQVASSVGMRVDREGCGANALLVVVDDKEQFLAALAKKYPAFFAEARGLAGPMPSERGPAIAWHVESLLDSNGVKPTLVRTPDGGRFFAVNSFDSSRLKPAARPHFVAGTLVIERAALGGLTTTQLADYAAMRLFIRTKPGRMKRGGAPTILTVIDTPVGAPAPLTMTEWDFAVLKSLYATDPMQFATQQRKAMVSDVRKELRATGSQR